MNAIANPSVVEKTFLGLPIPSRRFLRVLYRHLTCWKKYIFASLIGTIGEAFLYIFSLGLGLAHYIGVVDGMPYIQYLAAGIWMSSAMYTACFESTFGTFTRYHEQKTFDAILATPIQLDEIILAEVMFGGVRGLVTSVIIMGIFGAFGLILTPWTIFIIPLGFLTAMAFSSLSLIGTAMAKTYDFFSYYFVLVVTPMFLFSGIFFPLNSLPPWLEKIAWFTPLYHAVTASRMLFNGNLQWSILISILWLMLFTILCFYLALFAFRKRLLR